MLLTLSMGDVCSGAKADVVLEAQGSEIVRAPQCRREAYISAKCNVKLHPVIGEQTAEKSDFITRSQAYKQLDTSWMTFVYTKASVSFSVWSTVQKMVVPYLCSTSYVQW